MTEIPDGAPCWVDAMVPDLEAGQRFYGELLGWTYEDPLPEFGHYTQALSDGRRVAALYPPVPGMPEGPAAWMLYFRSSDVTATAARVRENGGQVLVEPMEVADSGSMMLATDPGGVTFGVWQPNQHEGFAKQMEPGAYCWSEICVKAEDVDAVDAFYSAVFPTVSAKRMGDGTQMDYKVWKVGDLMVTGRYVLGPDMPGITQPQLFVYFAVNDCDDAAATVSKLGGQVITEPMDSPYGRMAVVADQQGASFALIDPARTVGEPDPVED
ncbi:VOC family protein [Streptomyces sp. 4N509B]|uniref:VOC family protein n=1 Tax=Streptomyces sp. 4N509B TaxID=3457413 RepID=UPI003FD38DD8